ncbi:hypothetical protein ABTX81_30385 [Kitasatospora sp. NPDC097605]|uniref:hypothetical protein n=1 Tax=Kitasatospora sp. NPDC097605 TaxID=3157226 RepID=UPI00332414B8
MTADTDPPDPPMTACPVHPEKLRYATAEAATAAVTLRSLVRGYRRQRPYYCHPCGWFHVSTKPPRTVAAPTGDDGHALQDDVLARWFTTRTPDVQRHLVLKDLENLLAPELAAVLRHPEVVPAWLHVLKPLISAASLAADGPLVGRRAARARLALLQERRDEARALLPKPPTGAGTPAGRNPTTVRDYAAAALRRRQADEARAAAIALLIGRHPADWAQLLDHERRQRRLPPADDSGTAA